MTKKELLTTDALIKHMKTKGITFNLIDETAAKHFLEEHNYYFKLSAYRNNYLKHQTGDNKGKYIHLDFSYLKELSVIDMHLRYLLLELCLDIEHAIKIALINDAVINPEEDGYKIINKYLQHYTISATTHKGAYCSDLINKHKKAYPIWVFCEICSFGDLCLLYKLYNTEYPKRLPIKPTFLFAVKNIRNAVAHSNCLIYNLGNKSFLPNNEVSNVVSKIKNIKETTRRNKLKNKFLHDFAALLYCYSNIVKSEGVRKHQLTKLKKLFYHRMFEHKEYFLNNDIVKSSFSFCHKLLVYFSKTTS